jgi:hypothetical protein
MNYSAERKEDIIKQLVCFYEEKKRLLNKDYKYLSTQKYDEYFSKAADICLQTEVHPGVYIDTIFNSLGAHKHFFSPAHLQTDKAKETLSKTDDLSSYNPVVTRSNLSYDKVWDQQKDLVDRLLRAGLNLEDILLDPGNKLYAWFRILSTSDKNLKILDRYKEIAIRELNERLIEFIKKAGLDLLRITS